MNTDRTQITSLCDAVAASLLATPTRHVVALAKIRSRAKAGGKRSKVSVFPHELLNLAYHTIEFVDEIRMISVLPKRGHKRSVIPNGPVFFSSEPLEHFEAMSAKLSQNRACVMQLIRR